MQLLFRCLLNSFFLTTAKNVNRFDKTNMNNWTVSITNKSVGTAIFELPEYLWKTDAAAVTTRPLLSLWTCLERVTDTYWAVKLQYYNNSIYLTESKLSDKEELASFPSIREVMAIVLTKELGFPTLLFSLVHCIRIILFKNRNENPPRKGKLLNILMFLWFTMYSLHVLQLSTKDLYCVSDQWGKVPEDNL